MISKKIILLILLLTSINYVLAECIECRDDNAIKDWSFIWTGNTIGFTDEEYDHIANNYEYIIFTKVHHSSSNDIASHHAAAREIKSRNPDAKIFPYWGATLWFPKEFKRVPYCWSLDDEFDEDWYLRDTDGNPIENRVGQNVYYMNLSDPELRAWAIEKIDGWMQETYDNKPLYGEAIGRTLQDFSPELNFDA